MLSTCSEQDFALWICPKSDSSTSLGGMSRELPSPGHLCLCGHIKHSLTWAKGRPWPQITPDNAAGGTLCQGEGGEGLGTPVPGVALPLALGRAQRSNRDLLMFL